MRPDALWRGSVALGLIALALIGTLGGIAWRRSHPTRDAPRLVVTFFDVGAGDCALVQTPEGRAILLDTGPEAASPAVVAGLRRRNVRTIDLLVLTSPGEGSLGGVPALLESGMRVTQIWDNSVSDAGDARRDALEAIRRRHIPSSTRSAGDAIQVGANLSVSVLWPPDRGRPAQRDPLVCRLNYGGTAFVFGGAATRESERDLVGQAGRQIECEGPCTDLILQAGGAEAPSAEMLRRAGPSVVVLSCGPNDPPTSAALHRLRAAGCGVWRTDLQGDITVTATGRLSPNVGASRLTD